MSHATTVAEKITSAMTPDVGSDELTRFQVDLLVGLGRVGPCSGLDLKAKIDERYAETTNHGRLYPNLDTLVDLGLVERGRIDRRTNSYQITDEGELVLEDRLGWLRGGL